MKAVVFPLCAALAFVMLVSRVRVLRRDWRNPPLAALCAMLFLVATLFTLSVPAVSLWIDEFTGRPNLAAFCIHASIIMASFSMHGLTIFWTYPSAEAWRRLQRQLVVLSVVLGVMLALFTNTGITERYEHYLIDNLRNPVVTVYAVFFILVFARGQFAIAAGCWRYSRVARDPWLRRGLRVATAGTVIGMGYSATRLGNVVAVLADADVTKAEILVPICAGLATILTVVGLALPLLGPRLAGAVRRISHYLAYRTLAGLWRALYSANPEIALNPPQAGVLDLLQVGDLDYRVYRRVIEIHDGRLTLRRWIGAPDVAGARARAAALTGEAFAAAVEARLLRSALDAKDAGRLPDDPAPSAFDTRDHEDFTAEIAWLVRVARAFGRLPASGMAARETAG